MDDYGQFKDSSDYQVYPECEGQLIMVYNKKAGIASNPKIRQAINAALNNNDILKAAYVEDIFVTAKGSLMLVETSEWYTTVGTEYYNQNDPEKAKQLLSEAGYNGEEFRIVASSAYPAFYNAALVIEQNLQAAGVNVVLDVVDWATYLSKAKDETAFEAYITSCSIKSVPTQLYYLDEAAGWPTLDPKISELKNVINTSSDKTTAIAAWSELQEYMWTENVPVSVIGNSYYYSIASSKVKDLIYFEGPHAWNVTLE
jgi:peptide/nickel transport system substrate-binding protein